MVSNSKNVFSQLATALGNDQINSTEYSIPVLDDLTRWLIRIACVLIIFIALVLIIAVPSLAILIKFKLSNALVVSKDIIKSFL